MKVFAVLTGLASILCPLSPLSSPPDTKQATPPNLQVIRTLSDSTLPAMLEWASDVRWAGEKSVYLALSFDGTVEMSLDPSGPPKEMIPGNSKPGGFWGSWQLAASSHYLVAAAPALVLTWRRIEEPIRVEVPFESVEAIDLRENRLAIVGAPRNEKGVFGAEGAIAWLGSLDKKLEDARPLLYDVQGPGVPTLNRCVNTFLSAVRFLADGSLVILPGFQPGMNLYNSTGQLVRTWDTSALGIDSDCGALTDRQGAYLKSNALARHIWVNQRRTVDTILPFSQGPGLVVREVEQGRTRWKLLLLRLDGSVQNYAIPLEGENEFFHLEGDLRAGKIIFLIHESVMNGRGKNHPIRPRLIVAEPPGSAN